MESHDAEYATRPHVNGQQPPAAKPAELWDFGDEPQQMMRPEIMHAMIKDLFATDKPTFARLMWRAYGGDDTDLMPAPKRGRGAAQ